jgi:hypothetical protein
MDPTTMHKGRGEQAVIFLISMFSRGPMGQLKKQFIIVESKIGNNNSDDDND